MITGIYEGGLGNLMFQIAAGMCLSIDNNDVYKINPSRHIGRGQGNHISNYLHTIFSKIEKTDFISSNIFEHISNKYKEIHYSENLCLRGYFQNFNYIKSYQNKLKEIFHFDYINFNKIKEKKILSIHVRTGDYNYYNHFNILNKNYYENCLNKINVDEYEIFLISDYPSEAQKVIPDIPYKIFHKSELADMFLMSKSDVCIISNSTFAWWGSFLGEKKITYAPYIWNTDVEEFENIYSEEMIKIKF
jgi:hypothetical protein